MSCKVLETHNSTLYRQQKYSQHKEEQFTAIHQISPMSLLTSQMTPKMSTAYSGLSALIQAATSQLGDLAETNSPEGSPPFLSNPTTPTLEGPQLDLDGTSSWHRNGAGAATVTPVLSSIDGEDLGNTTLYFPEVLMLLLSNPANEDIVTFLPDGKYFAIRRLEFTKELLRQHFRTTNFEDFLKEARGWGFIRVNGDANLNCNGTSNTYDGDCNKSSGGAGNSSSISKDEISVFRHAHFEKNQPVDVDRMRHQRQNHECFIPGDKATTSIGNEQNVHSETNSSKRQLPRPTDTRDFDDSRQRLRVDSRTYPVDADPFILPGSSCDQSLQLRRRSSLELRGVAQAITASKLQLNSSMEILRDENTNQGLPRLSDANGTAIFHNGSDHSTAQLERRQSTASSLVDGGVETATQNIVTDAIEALLFDEGHTRETYNRHEKELSMSSFPGVVPISKQLFSDNDTYDMGFDSKKNTEETNETKLNTSSERKEKDKKSELVSSWVVPRTTGILKDASRNNGGSLSTSSLSIDHNVQVVIPSDRGEGLQNQGKSTDRSMVVSPARMEAAAALVSQARNRIDEC